MARMTHTLEGSLKRTTSATTRKVMQSNRGRDTEPELRLRRRLHSMGLRYRVGLRPEQNRRRSIDIAFTKTKVAIFVDGCFWHGCPSHSRPTKSNSDFWSGKISRNKLRDSDTNALLESNGWTVIRFWEHDDFELAAVQIYEVVKRLQGVIIVGSVDVPRDLARQGTQVSRPRVNHLQVSLSD